MVKHYAVFISLPHFVAVPECEKYDAQCPEQHLDDSSDVASFVKRYIWSLETEFFSDIVNSGLVLSTENEIVGNISILKFHHHRRHLDQLGFGADKNVDHALLQLGIRGSGFPLSRE